MINIYVKKKMYFINKCAQSMAPAFHTMHKLKLNSF